MIIAILRVCLQAEKLDLGDCKRLTGLAGTRLGVSKRKDSLATPDGPSDGRGSISAPGKVGRRAEHETPSGALENHAEQAKALWSPIKFSATVASIMVCCYTVMSPLVRARIEGCARVSSGFSRYVQCSFWRNCR